MSEGSRITKRDIFKLKVGDDMMEIRKPKKSDIEGLKRLSANFADEYEWGDKIPIGQIDTAKKAEDRKATPKMGFELEDKFLEDEFILGRKYHVYVFTRSGEKSSK